MRKILLLLTSLLITTTAILAQNLPNEFKYQAVLRDASGEILANEPATVTIAILQGTASGTSVFDESHSIITTAQGLINLNIGSINDMSVVDWSAAIYFVEISVNGTVMGTSQLLSVPYALHAKTVENDEVDDADSNPTNELQDLNLNGTLLEISNGVDADLSSLQDGIGTDNQNLTAATLTGTSLEIEIEDGNSTSVDLATLQDGTGTDNQNLTGATLTGTSLEIEIENGTSTSVDLVSLQDGTGTDDQELTLTGTTLEIENGNNVIFTGWDTDASDDFSGDYTDLTNQPTIPASVSDLSDFDTTGATDGQILQFNGTEWTPNNTIWTKSGDNIHYNAGLVGIGVTSPTASLDIYDNVGYPFLKFVSEDNVYTHWISDRANVDDYLIGIDGGNNRFLFANTTTGNYPLVLQGDNVGVGTLNPIAKLHTQTTSGSQPTAYFGTSSTSGQTAVLEVVAEGDSNPTNLLHIIDQNWGDTSNLLKVDSPAGEAFVITNEGNVGIGMENVGNLSARFHCFNYGQSFPTAIFEAYDGGGDADVVQIIADGSSDADNLLHIISNSSNSENLLKVEPTNGNNFIINENGNVGIGAPNVLNYSANLQVNAQANFAGIIVKANATNPGNIQEWKNGSGTTLNYVPNDGGIVFENLNTPNKGITFMADQTSGVSGAYGLFRPVANNTTSGLTLMPSGTGNASMLSVFATDALADESNSRGLFISANDTRFFIWPRNYGTETAKPFYIYKPGNAQTAAISVGTNGNIGINTATPSAAATLDVNGSIKLNESLSIETVDKEIRFATGRIISQSVPNRLTVESFVAGQPLFLRGPGGIQFAANGERMRITDNGNIGIGTTTPEAPLHISDFMKLEPRSTAPTSPTKGMIYYDDTDDKIKVYTGSVWENLN